MPHFEGLALPARLTEIPHNRTTQHVVLNPDAAAIFVARAIWCVSQAIEAHS
jgi:hypothetical protein